MALLVITVLAVIWFAVAEDTGWTWAYGVAMVHMAVACVAAESLL